MENNKPTVFIFEHAYAVYAAHYLIEACREQHTPVRFFATKKILEITKAYYKTDEVTDLSEFQSARGKKLTKLFEGLFVNPDFSATYRYRKAIKWSKSLRQLSKATSWLKLPDGKVNKYYSGLMSTLTRLKIIPKLPIGEEQVIAFTKVQHPYLLAPYAEQLTLIMESWDHPMKEPYLVYPRQHLAWNIALAKEARSFQHLPNVKCVDQSLKFRYVRERETAEASDLYESLDDEMKEDLDKLNGGTYFIYPMCTSSAYHGFAGEIDFLTDLVQSLKTNNGLLYVRPYPLAPASDTDKIAAIPGVKVGRATRLERGTDVLNEQEQTHKYLTIKRAAAVINVGTTFALDAAMIGTPVLQLRLENDNYGAFSSYTRGVHIVKHLWTKHSCSYEPGKALELNGDLRGQSEQFSARLKKWILTGTKAGLRFP